jgi:acetyl esterase/lipase
MAGTRLSLACALALLGSGVSARPAAVWQPSAGHVQVPIWPGTPPDPVANPAPEAVAPDWPKVTNVSIPTMTVYRPTTTNSGAAIIVFPGGGYQMLAMDLEGTEICDWLTSRGITCVLLKYRVPNSGPTWVDNHRLYPKVETALQDAQRTIGLVRRDAARYHVDPHRIGVIGFSAGGHLVAAVSTHFDRRTYPRIDSADDVSSRPDFAIALYPGHLWAHEDEDRATRKAEDLTVRPDINVSRETPPTFLLQAEDDEVDGVEQSIAYYVALQKFGVPAELHLYAQGGHAFGIRPSKHPISRWPALAETWLHTIGVLRP